MHTKRCFCLEVYGESEQSSAAASPVLPKEVTRRRPARARANSTARKSPQKRQGRPRKASKVLSDTNAEPLATAIASVDATLDDNISSDTIPQPEHIVATGLAVEHARADTADVQSAPTDAPNRVQPDASLTTEAVTNQKTEQSPISGGNVTRRRATNRGRRPTAHDRALVLADRPVPVEHMDVDDEVLPTDSFAPIERRRSSRLMRLSPDEAIEEPSTPSVKFTSGGLEPLSTNGISSEQGIEGMDHDVEDDLVQQRRILGTRPMRFKAPRNARVQTFDIEDIESEPQLDGMAEPDTQYNLPSTPTRHKTVVHRR
ncbi:hypothetical protein GGI21_004920, partial [Coemansia aciculifera]